MSITADQAWDNGTITDDSSTTITASGAALAANATALLFLAYTPNQAQTGTPTTPSGYTLETSSASPDEAYIFRKFLESAISSKAISLSAAPAGPVHLHLRSYTSTGTGNEFVNDQTPAIKTAIASTTIATNTQSTTGASAGTNDICLSFFVQRAASGTTPTWSSPTNSYALSGSRLSDNNGVVQNTTGIYTKTISANVTTESAGITSTSSTRSNAALISYTETAGVAIPPRGVLVSPPREIIPNDQQPIVSSNRFGVPAPPPPSPRRGLYPVVAEVETPLADGAVFVARSGPRTGQQFVKFYHAENDNTSSPGFTSVAVTIGNAQGNLLTAFVTLGSASASTPTWNIPAGWRQLTSNGRQACFVYPNAPANSNVTFSWTPGATAPTTCVVDVVESSGAGSAPIINTIAVNKSGSPMSITPTGSAGELLIVGFADTSPSSTPPAFGAASVFNQAGTNTTTDGTTAIRGVVDYLLSPGGSFTDSRSTDSSDVWFGIAIDITANSLPIPATVPVTIRETEMGPGFGDGAVFVGKCGGQVVLPLPPRVVVRESEPPLEGGQQLAIVNRTPAVTAKPPTRVHVRAPEEPWPAAGSVLHGSSGALTSLAPPQARGVTLVVSELPGLPAPGSVVICAGLTAIPGPQKEPPAAVVVRESEPLPADGLAVARSGFTGVRVSMPPSVLASSPDMPEAGSVIIHVGHTVEPRPQTRPGVSAIARQDEPSPAEGLVTIHSGLAAIQPRAARPQIVEVSAAESIESAQPVVYRSGPPLPAPPPLAVIVREQEPLPGAGQVVIGSGLTAVPAAQLRPGRLAVIQETETALSPGSAIAAHGQTRVAPPDVRPLPAIVVSTFTDPDPGAVITGQGGSPLPSPPRAATVVQAQDLPADPGGVVSARPPFQRMQPSPRPTIVVAEELPADTPRSPLPASRVSVQAPAPVRPPRAHVIAEPAYIIENLTPVYACGRPTAAAAVMGPIYLSAAGVFVLGPTESLAYVLGPTAAQVFIIGPTEEKSR